MPDLQLTPLRVYHARTKHRFEAFAEGPGLLDWDAQPAAFRHYPGAPRLELPLSADRFERPFAELPTPPAREVAADLNGLGALLELSFAISAWKRWGSSRWALRCNPSSGNLHPVEAWILAGGLPGVPDGVHHYDPERHALEGRALTPPAMGQPRLAIGLSSIMWREAWKYGERAFRYCQLDVGHALGALAYAAAVLGWTIKPLAVSSENLSHLLGLDRGDDFPPSRYAFTETEEAEILVTIDAPGLDPHPSLASLRQGLERVAWQGRPSRIDPSPGYRWPVIDQAAAASRIQIPAHAPAQFHPLPALTPHPGDGGAVRIIRQRRSGQRFDPKCSLPEAAFFRMLDAVLPRPMPPFGAQEGPSRIHLLLFVLRVDGLSPGIYLLPRTPTAARELPEAVRARFPEMQSETRAPEHLGLIRLTELGLMEMQRLARGLSCHQDIASTSAFSLGMLGEFDDEAIDGYGYRELLREAGLVGQALYLEAEAAGFRGTGIGCFFDDPVHEACGLSGSRWQSVYHFTIGTPLVDSRIETLPAYER